MKTQRFVLFGGKNRTDLAGGFRDFIMMSDNEKELERKIDDEKLVWFQIIDIEDFKRKNEIIPRQVLSKYGNKIMDVAIRNKLEL